MADGRVSTKCDKDAYHIRDIEKYYEDYKKTVQDQFPHAEDIVTKGVSTTKSSTRPSLSSMSSGGASEVPSKRPRRSVSVGASTDLPLFYSEATYMQQSVLNASVCNLCDDNVDSDASDVGEQSFCVDSALYGDALMYHCMATGTAESPELKEPNTIKQAYALPDRDKWREAVEAELEMIRQFNVFSPPVKLPPGAIPLSSRWVFKRKRDHLGNVVKYVSRSDYKGKKLEDLEKAQWYLSREISNLSK
jgi:hypothetical protein